MATTKNPRKKILFLVTKSNWGGAQRYVFDLARNLPLEEWDITVGFGGTGEKGAVTGKLAEKLSRHNIRTIFIRSMTKDVFLWRDFQSLREIYSLLRTGGYDIVHLNSSKISILGSMAAYLARVPKIVFTVHGWPFLEKRNLAWRIIVYAASWLTAFLSTNVITINRNDFSVGQKMWPISRKISLIYLGIEDERLASSDETRRIIEEKIGQSLPTFWIGTIAELTPNKNLSGLIRVVSKLPSAMPWTALIIGDGEERRRLESLIIKLGLTNKVYLVGFIPDAGRLVSGFDIFVLPSQKEGLPYVLLEAGLAGRAVIASRVGGVPDIVDHGVSGTICSPNDYRCLREAIERYWQDKTMSLSHGQALKETVRSRFSLGRMISETINLYTA